MGLTCIRTGSFASIKKTLVINAYLAMYDVFKSWIVHKFSVRCHNDLFNKIVKPISLDGCEIWRFINTDIISRVNMKF